ncbi:MAG: hypothetical protein V4662_25080 [Verrucomicrobiota bacterium]
MNPTLKRITKAPASMTCAEAGVVMDICEDTVKRLVKAGKIGSQRFSARKDATAMRERQTTRITRAALLRYLVRTSHGDERDELLHDITEHAPQWVDMAKRAAEAAAADQAAQPARPDLPQRLASFGQPSTTARRPAVKPDPFATHPDLFEVKA